MFDDARIVDILRYPDAGRSQRVMQALLGRVKLDIEALRTAYAG